MEIIVYNYTELKNAIESGTFDRIILGDDITYGSPGISVPATMTILELDGADPLTQERHTIIDANSTAIARTIYIDPYSSIARNITIKNVIFWGRNYYGIVGVYETPNNAQVTLTYQNITYYGVQPFYNRYGKCVIIDSDFIIDKYTSSSAINELAETNILEFYGEVNIESFASANSTIWFLNNSAKMIIKENSHVYIYTHAREIIFTYVDVDILIEENAILDISSARGMFYSTGSHQAGLFEVRGKFFFLQRAAYGAIPTIRCRNFTARQGSEVIIKVPYTPSATLLDITQSGGTISIADPKRFVLYNLGNKVLDCTNVSFTSSSSQFNYWVTPLGSEGTIADYPTYHWTKADGSLVTINGTINSTSSSFTSNILVPDDSPTLLTPATCPLHSARVISAGILNGEIDEINDNISAITGMTESSAEVRIDQQIVIADASGYFAMLVDPLTKGTTINFLFAKSFLYLHREVVVLGSIYFLSVPTTLDFKPAFIPLQQSIIRRQISAWAIIIKDTRDFGEDFEVYASITSPLSKDQDTLDDALIFIEQAKQIIGATPILIYRGQGNQQSETITTISYDELEGILVELLTAHYYPLGLYQTTLTFTLKTQI